LLGNDLDGVRVGKQRIELPRIAVIDQSIQSNNIQLL